MWLPGEIDRGDIRVKRHAKLTSALIGRHHGWKKGQLNHVLLLEQKFAPIGFELFVSPILECEIQNIYCKYQISNHQYNQNTFCYYFSHLYTLQLYLNTDTHRSVGHKVFKLYFYSLVTQRTDLIQ